MTEPDLDALPFPVAYPLLHARAEGLQPAVQFQNLLFAAYQALRLTSLLLLADYLRRTAAAAAPGDERRLKTAALIRKLRRAQWGDWADLARELSIQHLDPLAGDGPLPALTPIATAYRALRDGCSAEERTLVATLHEALDRFGIADRPAAAKGMPPISALLALRNAWAHKAGTQRSDLDAKVGQITESARALVHHIVGKLFGATRIELILGVSLGEGSAEVVRLIGPHRNNRFVTEDTWDAELCQALQSHLTLARFEGGDVLPLPAYPWLLPMSTWRAGAEHDEAEILVEPVGMVEALAQDALVVMGVERVEENRDPRHVEAFKACLAQRGIELVRSAAELYPQTDAALSQEFSRRKLAELTDSKYFPGFYVPREGVDDRFLATVRQTNKAVMLLGTAGSGKSSLMCRLVDHLLTEERAAAPAGPAAEQVLAPAPSARVVVFLSGAADFLPEPGALGQESDEAAQLESLDGYLAGIVARCLNYAPKQFRSLRSLVAALSAAPGRGPQTPPAEVWLVFDAINEAAHFMDLVRAIDRFLPSVAAFDHVHLALSLRLESYRSGLDRVQAENHLFANHAQLHRFRQPDDRDMPYLEVRPFREEPEARLAYERRQALPPSRPTKWDRLSASMRELLQTPLYLHLFHQSAGQAEQPADEAGLLSSYLDALGAQGLTSETLLTLGRTMLELRSASLPEEALSRLDLDWLRSKGYRSRTFAVEFSPLEMLVSHAVLLREVEPRSSDAGRDGKAAGFVYQFVHEKLAEAVLVRAVRARVPAKPMGPDGDDLVAWAGEAVDDQGRAFAPFVGALGQCTAVLVRKGRWPEACRALAIESRAVHPAITLAFVEAVVDLDGARRGAALDALGEFLEQHPADAVRFGFAAVGMLDWLLRRARVDALVDVQKAAAQGFGAALVVDRGDGAALRGQAWANLQVADLAGMSGQPELQQRSLIEAHEAFMELAEADRSNVEYQRDLSISYNRLGDLARAAGDMAQARQRYEAGLAIAQALAEADRSNVQYQRDLSISYDRLGDLARAAGDMAQARQRYEAGLAIRMALAEADRSNVEYQRDLSISHNRLGDLARAAGDMAQARQRYEADLAIAQALAEADRSNVEYQRDLSISYERLGDLARAAGEVAKSREFYRSALAVVQSLADSAPNELEHARRLAWLHADLADVVRTAGDGDAVVHHTTQARSRRRALPGIAFGSEAALAQAWQRSLAPPIDWPARPVPGAAWTTLPSEQAIETLRTVAAALLLQGQPVPWLQAGPKAVRTLALAGYAEAAQLIEVLLPLDAGVQAIAAALQVGELAQLLDGRSDPIHRINAVAGLALADEQAVARYLSVFCTHVRSDDVPFLIVDDPDTIEWQPRATDEDREQIRAWARPIQVERDEASGSFRARALILYQGSLFRAEFSVSANGAVEMTSDEPVMADAPIDAPTYQGPLRIVPIVPSHAA